MGRIYPYLILLRKDDHILFWEGKLVLWMVKYIDKVLHSQERLGRQRMVSKYHGVRFIGEIMVEVIMQILISIFLNMIVQMVNGEEVHPRLIILR